MAIIGRNFAKLAAQIEAERYRLEAEMADSKARQKRHRAILRAAAAEMFWFRLSRMIPPSWWQGRLSMLNSRPADWRFRLAVWVFDRHHAAGRRLAHLIMAGVDRDSRYILYNRHLQKCPQRKEFGL